MKPSRLYFLRHTPLALALALTSGCGRTDAPTELPARPVVTTTVEEPATGRSRTFAGVTRGEVETPISFRVGGEIAELPVQSGDEVKAGDLIARLDTSDLELEVRRLDAQTALAQAQKQQATAEYARVRALFEANNVSRSEFDRARAARDAAEAQWDTAREGLNQARRQLAHGTRHAPRDGTIISVPANRYQFVSPGQPVAVLRADQAMVLEVTVAETLANDLTIDQPATVTLEAMPGPTFAAHVSEIGAGLSGLAAVPVSVRIQDPPASIRSGQAGEARIEFPTTGAGVRVPLAAITGAAEGQRFAWVVDRESETVQRRPVTTGRLQGEMLEVSAGLEPGETIVVRGANRLSDGQRVRVTP